MCGFFSVISDGKGNIKFFKPEDVVSIMASGNKENYDFNSHTSLSHFFGIKASNEHNWNKWEYNPESKELKKDESNQTDDSSRVKVILEKLFESKDILYLKNLYGKNSGHGNSGDRNSGDRNSGNWNSGDRNSGNGNSGYWNSGHGNSGHRNSGDRNSGDRNSGNGNSGDWNSGDRNSGIVMGSFCSENIYMLFNKPCTKEEHDEIYKLDWSWFKLIEFISNEYMTEAEKKAYPFHKTIGGYLKEVSYKEVWEKIPKEFLDNVKKLKNFDSEVFKGITGLNICKIKRK